MPIRDRMDVVKEVRDWTDSIPLRYEYTAGVAGERFLRGLRDGKILASRCSACGDLRLPPRTYCLTCYGRTVDYVEVKGPGVVYASTLSRRDAAGRERHEPASYAYVTFQGIKGGLFHILLAGGQAGSEVSAKFKPPSRRTGSILDIEGFLTVNKGRKKSGRNTR